MPPEHYAPFDAALEKLFAARTNVEILAEAVARKLLVAPTLTLAELDGLAHFRERGSFVEVEHAEPGLRVRYPGPFARFGASPLRYTRPPPRLDEHGAELRAERAPARPSPPPASSRLPLAGVRILDFFWVLAGPAATRTLADFGATVVHVESTRRVDTIRTIPPWYGGAPSPDGSGPMQGANAGKLCITLDLAHPSARPVIERLVKWADVVTESFAPGVIARLGLDYASLAKLRPDTILISSCLMGQSGPLRDFAGFGNLAAAVTGFQHFAGWPDRAPVGPAGAYTDFVAARYNALAILAALDHRERTGQGQWIDQSQAESAFHFLAPALLDHALNGRVPAPCGNDDPELSPHGVYPAAGADRWLGAGGARSRATGRRCARCSSAPTGPPTPRSRAPTRDARAAQRSTPRSPLGRARASRTRPSASCRRAAFPLTRCSTCPACSPTRSSATAATSSTSRTRRSARSRSSRRASSCRAPRRACRRRRSASAATTGACSASCSASRPTRSPRSKLPAR